MPTVAKTSRKADILPPSAPTTRNDFPHLQTANSPSQPQKRTATRRSPCESQGDPAFTPPTSNRCSAPQNQQYEHEKSVGRLYTAVASQASTCLEPTLVLRLAHKGHTAYYAPYSGGVIGCVMLSILVISFIRLVKAGRWRTQDADGAAAEDPLLLCKV
jgi:hypothetical protein